VAIPNGPASIAAVLISQGHRVEILDLLFAGDVEEAIITHLEKYNRELVGISLRETDNNELFGFRFYLENAKRVVDLVKKHSHAQIIIGGAAFTLFPLELLQYLELSYGISGDGEESLPLFVKQLEAGHDFDSIPGMCYQDGNEIKIKPPAIIHDLDSMPLPAYELLDLKNYMATAPGLTIQSKKGCDMACSFCPEGNGIEECRLRDAGMVVDEMQTMMARHHINRFHFTDGIFNIPLEHAIAVCDEIIRRKINVSWMAGISPACVNREFVTAMKASGCRYISFGVDTASEKMLENYRKGFKKQEITAAADLLKESGIRFDYSILFGGPGENMETVQETLDFIEQVSQQIMIRAGIRIFPGTELEEQARADGMIKPGQNLMFPTFYLSKELPPDFMKWLDNQCEKHTNWITITKLLNKSPVS
jgi:radical SAM superfamily enzyme YgiQ (UPF0313 family)